MWLLAPQSKSPGIFTQLCFHLLLPQLLGDSDSAEGEVPWALGGRRVHECKSLVALRRLSMPTRELTYPIWGNGTSSSTVLFLGGYVSSQEGKWFQILKYHIYFWDKTYQRNIPDIRAQSDVTWDFSVRFRMRCCNGFRL